MDVTRYPLLPDDSIKYQDWRACFNFHLVQTYASFEDVNPGSRRSELTPGGCPKVGVGLGTPRSTLGRPSRALDDPRLHRAFINQMSVLSGGSDKLARGGFRYGGCAILTLRKVEAFKVTNGRRSRKTAGARVRLDAVGGAGRRSIRTVSRALAAPARYRPPLPGSRKLTTPTPEQIQRRDNF